MCKALFFPNVLDHKERVILDFEPGMTVDEWLRFQGLAWINEDGKYQTKQPIVVAMNGDALLEKDWDHVLESDDMIALQAAPQAEGVASLIYYIVVAVTAAYALYTVLTLPDPATDGIETSPNNNLSVRSNRARLGQPKPVLYGKSIVYPDISAQPYSRFAANGDEIVYLLFEVSQGEINIDTNTMRFESTPLSDFPSAEYEIVTPGNTSTLFPNDVVNVAAVSNIELDAGLTTEYTVNDPNTDITRISLDIVAPRGIYRARSSGKRDRMSILFEIQTIEVDDVGTEIGSWTTNLSAAMSGATASPIARTYDVTLPAGRYKVRINRLGSYSADDKLVDQLQWAGLSGFFEDALPATTTTRVAVRIRSSNEIGNRALTQFNLVAQRLLPTWSSGGGWTAPVATNSPAWAAADVLRNTVYGAKRADAFINLDDLAQLAVDAAAAGFECNGVIDTSGTVWDALTRIGHTCDAIPVDEGGVYTLIQDKAQTVPVQMFNMRNIKRGTFRMDASPHVEETKDYVEVKFKDELQDYRQTSIDAIVPGGTSNDPLKLEWWGITAEAQAWELGMRKAAANRYRRERITFETGLEGRIPRYGDLVRVSHQVFDQSGSPQVSGDVLAYDNVDLLTMSEEIPVYATPFILLQAQDGDPLGPYACTRVNANQVRIDEAFDDSGLIFANNYDNPRFQMGDTSTFDENVRILGIQPVSGEDVRIEGFIDQPIVYTITNGETQPAPVTAESLLKFLPSISKFRGILGGSPGDLEVSLSWEGSNSDKYDLEYSVDAGVTWIDMGEDLLVSKYTDRPGTTGLIRYRVAGVSVLPGPWSEITVDLDAAIGSGNVPPAPNKLNVNSMSEGVELVTCVPFDEALGDPEVIEIWRVTDPDTLIGDASAVLVESVPVTYDQVNNQFAAYKVDGTVTGGTSYSYFARAANRHGNSAYYPSGAGVPVTPSSPSTGGPGPAGADAISAAPVLQSWARNASGGYDGTTPFNAVIRFIRANSEVATHTVRGTLNVLDGTISVTDVGETGEDTNITSTVGAGSQSVRVEVTHVASGSIGVIVFTSSGGQDGIPGLPGASYILDYDNLNGLVPGSQGEYAFSEGATFRTGWANITSVVDTLYLDTEDSNGVDQSGYFAQLQAGADFVVWFDSDRKWVEWKIVTKTNHGAYWSFGLSLVKFDEADGAGDPDPADGVPVEIRFSRAPAGSDGDDGTDGTDGTDGADAVIAEMPTQITVWSTNNGTNYSPPELTVDHTVRFKRSGVVVATRTVRTTRSGSNVSNASIGSTGEATTYSESGDGTTSAVATVEHTGSGAQATAGGATLNTDIGSPTK